MYFFLILPLLTFIIIHYFFIKNKIGIRYEFTIPIVVSLLYIIISTEIYKSTTTTSTEYRGYLVTDANYYEYWETWITETCSREVPCGKTCNTDSNGNTTCTTNYCTEYYDCSYCDKNEPYWIVNDIQGGTHIINETYFNKLKNQWSSPLIHINLNRKIKKRNGCGINGNMYKINWDNKIETSESVVLLKSYKNKIKNSKSTFNYKTPTKEEVIKYGLYEYPKKYEFYKQNPILGIDSLNIRNKKEIIKKYEFLNGIGYKTHNKTFVLLFPDKDIQSALYQEYYWLGGNRNELVICIGYDSKTQDLNWVKSFTWSEKKIINVNIREDLMKIGKLDLEKFYPIIVNNVTQNFKPKDFKEFDYLEIEYSDSFYYINFIVILLITFFINFLLYKNLFN